MPNSDSHLSTHSTPPAQLILSLLSFPPIGINVLKYLFIWMFVTLFWPNSSFVLHWVSASEVSDFMPDGKMVSLERESSPPITETKLKELPSSVHLPSSQGNWFSSSNGRKYCYTGPCFAIHCTTCQPQCGVKLELKGQGEETRHVSHPCKEWSVPVVDFACFILFLWCKWLHFFRVKISCKNKREGILL